MATEAGQSAADVGRLESQGYRFALFAALRLLERAYPERPRLGESRRARDDAVRLQQPPHLFFAPSDVEGLHHDSRRAPRLEQFSYGLFGPNGALPQHLTEYAFERRKQFDDPTLSDFINLFQHRLIALFYRAWANADPATNYDRPASDRFRLFLGALIGLGPAAARDRDSVRDFAKLSRVGQFGPRQRSAAGLEAALASYFRLRVAVRQFVGSWLDIPPHSYCRLGNTDTALLGLNATLGMSTWQCQQKFEIIVGPIGMEQFLDFLPGARGLKELRDLVRLYTNDEWSWQVRLLLKVEDVPRAQLGAQTRLGWVSWLGGRRVTANDVVLSGEQAAA